MGGVDESTRFFPGNLPNEISRDFVRYFLDYLQVDDLDCTRFGGKRNIDFQKFQRKLETQIGVLSISYHFHMRLNTHNLLSSYGIFITPSAPIPGRVSATGGRRRHAIFCFFSTLVTGLRRSLIFKLSDPRVYAPQIRACLGIGAHFPGLADSARCTTRAAPTWVDFLDRYGRNV